MSVLSANSTISAPSSPRIALAFPVTRAVDLPVCLNQASILRVNRLIAAPASRHSITLCKLGRQLKSGGTVYLGGRRNSDLCEVYSDWIYGRIRRYGYKFYVAVTGTGRRAGSRDG